MPLTLSDIKLQLGYGTYGASGAYGSSIDAKALYQIILAAYEAGIRLIDTAAIYGSPFGQSELDVGVVLKRLIEEKKCTRDDLFIATKCGISPTFAVENSYKAITESCDESLGRLQIDTIDLFFLHRHDPSTPIEEIAQAMSDLIDQNKIHSVGLSEVNEETIRAFSKAMEKLGKKDAFVSIQSEYSLTNPHVGKALLPICAELNLTFFAYSPFAKGLLTDQAITDPSSVFKPAVGALVPQLAPEHQLENLKLLAQIKKIADQVPCSVAQLSLAWLMMQQGVVSLMSTSNPAHLLENMAATQVNLSSDIIAKLNQLPNISGSRRSDWLRNLAPEMGRYSPTP